MTERKNSRMGHMIPVLTLVLMFVLCCAVLTGVFLQSATIGRQTQAYNAAVQLCRNQAELYRSGNAGAGSYRYDENFLPTTEDAAAYRLEVTQRIQTEVAGELRTATIQAFDREGQLLYQLEAAVYLPGEEAAYGE